MASSTGCKVAITALVVAILMGSLGFAAGFITHTMMVVPPPGSTATLVALEATAIPPTLEPSATATEVPPPTATARSTEPAAVPTASPPPTEPPPTELPSPTAEDQVNLDRFWEVWQLIRQDYYGDLPTEEELINGAIRGTINSLDDPFTGYIERQVAVISRENDSGSFEGIGAYVTMDDGLLMIVSTFKGQPASEAGLQRGDVVLKVDDTLIENMSLYEAVALIRGPAGTKVRLTLQRVDEQPFEVELTRARINIPVVESEMRADGIAYVRLLGFSSNASVKLQLALAGLLAQNPTGLVLDLRGNPGGLRDEAVLVANQFLPKDQVVLIERYKDGQPRLHKTEDDAVVPDLPLAVLVDAGSASASEIVAGALQDLGRSVLVGERTFGKGSVQLAYELSDGAELRVTVARWFTPNDRAIHGQGLEPDIVVELTNEDLQAGRDPQLERAVEHLLKGQ